MPSYIDKIWEIRASDFPATGGWQEKISFVLRYAILAPSTHNTQPWLFSIRDNVCDVYADDRLLLPAADPSYRDLCITFGCLAEHIQLTGEYFGLRPKIEFTFNAEGWQMLHIVFTESDRDVENERLVSAMLTRINVRGLFDRKPVPPTVLDELSRTHDSQLELHVITDKSAVKRLAAATAQAIVEAHQRQDFRAELSTWMKSNLTQDKDGLIGYNLRMPLPASVIIPPLIKRMNLGKLFSKLNYRAVASAPAVGVITSPRDSFHDWYEVGRFFQRLSLDINSQGLKTSVYIGAVEIGDNRRIVQQVVRSEALPQFLFAFGYLSGNFKHSPRHPLSVKLLPHE